MNAGGIASVIPMRLRAEDACWISLALFVLAKIVVSRSSGPSTFVATETNMLPTLLPTSLASRSVRNDTGTDTTSGRSGRASRSTR